MLLFFSSLGTDGIRSKTKRKITAEKNPSKESTRLSWIQLLMRDGVSLNAQHVLTNNVQWELYWSLVLTSNGTFIVAVEAILLSQKDLSDKDEQLINILCDANVPPLKISKIMNNVKEDDKGTLLPKTIFNINEKCRQLIDFANGILPTCTDVEKTLKLLELWVFFTYIIFHFLLVYLYMGR